MTSSINRSRSSGTQESTTLEDIRGKMKDKVVHLILKTTIGAPVTALFSLLYLPYDIATTNKQFAIGAIEAQIKETDFKIRDLTSPSSSPKDNSNTKNSQRKVERLLRMIFEKENELFKLLQEKEQPISCVNETQIEELKAKIGDLKEKYENAKLMHNENLAPIALSERSRKRLEGLENTLGKLKKDREKWYAQRNLLTLLEKMFTYKGLQRNLIQISHLRASKKQSKSNGETFVLSQETVEHGQECDKSKLPIKLQIENLKKARRSFSPVRGELKKV